MKIKSLQFAFILILCFGAFQLHAQEYRLVSATNYRDGAIEDSVYLRFSWNRLVNQKSLIYLQTPYDQYKLNKEKHDTFYHFTNGNMTDPSEYTFSQYDFENNLKHKIYGDYLEERVEGYFTDTLRRIGKQLDISGQQWVDKIKNETVFYTDRKIEIRYEWNGGQWNPTTRWENIYLSDGDSVIISYVDPNSSAWEQMATESYRYDTFGRLIQKGTFIPNAPYDVYSYAYHKNGETKEYRLDEYYHDTMKTYLRYTSSLNSNEEIDSIHHYYYSENQVTSHFIAVAEYDGQNRISRFIGKIDPSYPNTLKNFDTIAISYLNNTKHITSYEYILATRTFVGYYTYETFNNNVGLATLSLPITPTVYPNPSAHQISIDWPKKEGVILFIMYDGRGKEVFSKKLDKSSGLFYIPENINAGLYYYRLQSGAEQYSGKLQLLP